MCKPSLKIVVNCLHTAVTSWCWKHVSEKKKKLMETDSSHIVVFITIYIFFNINSIYNTMQWSTRQDVSTSRSQFASVAVQITWASSFQENRTQSSQTRFKKKKIGSNHWLCAYNCYCPRYHVLTRQLSVSRKHCNKKQDKRFLTAAPIEIVLSPGSLNDLSPLRPASRTVETDPI